MSYERPFEPSPLSSSFGVDHSSSPTRSIRGGGGDGSPVPRENGDDTFYEYAHLLGNGSNATG